MLILSRRPEGVGSNKGIFGYAEFATKKKSNKSYVPAVLSFVKEPLLLIASDDMSPRTDFSVTQNKIFRIAVCFNIRKK
jgi:hypothetical protein